MSTLIRNARFAGQTRADAYVLIEGEKIAAVGCGDCDAPQGCHVVDAMGALVMPAAIDCHVHFREPGMTAKADIATESRAAVAGGVASFMDMPNTRPATTTIEAWRQKCEIASRDSIANYAFFIGATNDNIGELRQADFSLIPGIKLFMGSSTGNMLVDDQGAIAEIFAEARAIVAVHAEDQAIISANAQAARLAHPGGVPVAMHSAIRSAEACYASTLQAVSLARKTDCRLHICHLTTARELLLLDSGPLSGKQITSEVSPHHLLWCDEDYAAKGARIKMNPAVKTAADRQALRQALAYGLIDMVATDHAPHLLADKEGNALSAASGAPLVQFALPLMLKLFDEQLVQRVMCENPAAIYGVAGRGRLNPGCYADIALVRPVDPYEVADSMAISKCGWTPLAGVKLRHRVEKTWVNGHLAYDQGRFDFRPGLPLSFRHNQLA